MAHDGSTEPGDTGERLSFRSGLIEGMFGPGLGTFAAMTGFGSLAGDAGTPLWAAVALTIGVWSMPGTYAWRLGGVLVAGRVEEGSPLFAWVTCVSFAIAAGLMMKLLVLPTGTLSESSFIDRSIGFVTAVTVFYLAKRRLVPALVVGVVFFFVLVSVRSAT